MSTGWTVELAEGPNGTEIRAVVFGMLTPDQAERMARVLKNAAEEARMRNKECA